MFSVSDYPHKQAVYLVFVGNPVDRVFVYIREFTGSLPADTVPWIAKYPFSYSSLLVFTQDHRRHLSSRHFHSLPDEKFAQSPRSLRLYLYRPLIRFYLCYRFALPNLISRV